MRFHHATPLLDVKPGRDAASTSGVVERDGARLYSHTWPTEECQRSRRVFNTVMPHFIPLYSGQARQLHTAESHQPSRCRRRAPSTCMAITPRRPNRSESRYVHSIVCHNVRVCISVCLCMCVSAASVSSRRDHDVRYDRHVSSLLSRVLLTLGRLHLLALDPVSLGIAPSDGETRNTGVLAATYQQTHPTGRGETHICQMTSRAKRT